MILLLEKYPFIISFILGLIPALVWLWFWLREDTHPEPAKMITLSFLGGMVAVVLTFFIQSAMTDPENKHLVIYNLINNNQNLAFFLFATVEEILKFSVIYLIALRNKITDEPVDDIIYLIIGAIGFATLENTLFLLNPVKSGNVLTVIIDGNMRFIGASLLHIVSSATIGICMALAFYSSEQRKIEYSIFGIILAILLHTSFNLFIINDVTQNIFLLFGMVWISIIILLLFFEKVKTIRRIAI
ncbi:MAG: PrsW family glutamic-type intramembrane protease [Parcubacteria group bacterium]